MAQFAPAFHGFYRALISTPYSWSAKHWTQLSANLNPLFEPSAIESLNRLVAEIIQLEESDPDLMDFVSSLIARYVSRGRPLSGYFLVCCIIEIQWTVLGQALTSIDTTYTSKIDNCEAAAANQAWIGLLESNALEAKPSGNDFLASLRATLTLSMECFSDLLIQIEEMESPPSHDSYAWETMSESLVRGYFLYFNGNND